MIGDAVSPEWPHRVGGARREARLRALRRHGQRQGADDPRSSTSSSRASRGSRAAPGSGRTSSIIKGKPDIGQTEAERLITQEKVHALVGAGSRASRQRRARSPSASASPTSTPSRAPRASRGGDSSGSSGRRPTTSTSRRRCSTSWWTSRRSAASSSRRSPSRTRTRCSGPTRPRRSAPSPRRADYRTVADFAYRANSTSLTAEVQKLKGGEPGRVVPDVVPVRRHPLHADVQGARLESEDDHRPELGPHRPEVHRGHREGLRRDTSRARRSRRIWSTRPRWRRPPTRLQGALRARTSTTCRPARSRGS